MTPIINSTHFISIVGHVPHVSDQLLTSPFNWHRVSCSFLFLPAHSQFIVAMPFRLNSGLSLQHLVPQEAMQFPVILSWGAQRNGVRFFPTHSQSRYPLCCRTSWRMILEWRRTYYGYYPLLVSNQVDSSHFSIDYQAFVDWLDQSLCKAMQTCFYNCADLQHQAQCKRNRLRYRSSDER